MADFTYDPSTDRGYVRILIADTREYNAHFTDAEIDAFLSRASNSVEGAAFLAAKHALAHAVRHADVRSEGKQGASRSRDNTAKIEGWKAVLNEYRHADPSPSGSVTYDGGRAWDVTDQS